MYIRYFLYSIMDSWRILKGSWGLLFISCIILCAAAAVFSYPKYHVKAFGALFLVWFLIANFSICPLKYSSAGVGYLYLWVTGYKVSLWYAIAYSVFYWVIIGIACLCRRAGIWKPVARVVVMLIAIALISGTVSIWQGCVWELMPRWKITMDG